MRLYKKIYHNDDGSWDPFSAPKLDFNENYYKVLEVDSDSSDAQIKKQFLKMIFKYHPDRVGIHPDNPEGDDLKKLRDQQTMVINAAYKTLRDETQRVEYDKKHREPIRMTSSDVGGFKVSDEELERRRQVKLAADEVKLQKKKEAQLKQAELRKASSKKGKESKKKSVVSREDDVSDEVREIYSEYIK